MDQLSQLGIELPSVAYIIGTVLFVVRQVQPVSPPFDLER